MKRSHDEIENHICPHGIEYLSNMSPEDKCPVCTLCDHGILWDRCIHCNSDFLQSLKRQKLYHYSTKYCNCIECLGYKNPRCPHGKTKPNCKECYSCPHGKTKYKCKECHPCPHNRIKSNCKECCPCPHGKTKSNCKECHSCPHGKIKHGCKICHPCLHGKTKSNCKECYPCPHKKLKYRCKECKIKGSKPKPDGNHQDY
jgi:hypothetical protein